MSNDPDDPSDIRLPVPSGTGRIARGALQVAGGAIPFAGGVLSAIAGAWSERDQEKVNRIFEHWIRMLEEELKEKEQTIVEIMARLDLDDQVVANRVESAEYQALLRKSFRNWHGAESDAKRGYVRNILTNAAASRICSDDVVRLFIDWIGRYSEMHFQVIGAIFNSAGISRGEIWEKIGRGEVREDSADADLYKLLFRDLSTGSIIRQHRDVDYHGNFIAKQSTRRPKGAGPKSPVSAFDDEEGYELTELGSQFVHYAMTDVPPKIAFQADPG